MSGTESGALHELRVVEAELNERWPETKIEPSLDRIRALTDLLAEPQRSYQVVHIGGTNGKSSVSRMVDSLLTRIGLRTGRYTSPHLQLATERISIDNKPITPEAYVEAYRDIAPYVSIVDSNHDVKMSKFEVLTGMAFAAFADAPVEAAVLEVGLGGGWDATNVADAHIAVLCPIALDHADYLGTDLAGIAREKSGIIKPDSIVVLAAQTAEVQTPILERVAEVGATVAREGNEFGVLSRTVAVGGQMLKLQGLGGTYDEIFLPLHGEHQARNAALALAAVEAFFGAGAEQKLDPEAVQEAFAAVITPGRLERVRAAPAVLVDAAHNPHGARALADALSSEFSFRRLVAVIGVLSDKDVRGLLRELEPVVEEVVLTKNSSPRAMDPDELAALAKDIFGAERIVVEPRLDDAVETAIQMAEETTGDSDTVSGGGVVITGSVVTAGEGRALFGKEPL
ncbi:MULTISPECIES: folylpolyglutamate synthase/dihydrofolate synthase family protein [unclassified Saccharopolyspora]|uniref:bifunctional tetrahydrofolate synthase/dihydrofolate synthase n=1 Tax=unclassified Saccharopolyspora TaxID=2646250 RepID=UPI001CD4FCD1|nr:MULTISPECIES: folylpolyglutamate synthase/dihydrofolate synthase family protein [unclassified Saccharopolyspora]MCA1188224.1 bifunctional folylpolyglutamate synthase/dihydrofolate synthase [Saccharopolyspora sp. 6T]MCA1192710.1 bifunctional folylpolyglutamate synthase/dihydrofolate synthase [Saccharopolyspora sp. 6V]MCA1227944.1 bifunctional folylpolyglutamate synthase/dihydrofolate synthase [Saccharopolyspora sp. 6M]MCA1280459.1 bifunctional folylpolyglutamate synthase/dihydrofolate synthas